MSRDITFVGGQLDGRIMEVADEENGLSLPVANGDGTIFLNYRRDEQQPDRFYFVGESNVELD
jgi:hypothetical protein